MGIQESVSINHWMVSLGAVRVEQFVNIATNDDGPDKHGFKVFDKPTKKRKIINLYKDGLSVAQIVEQTQSARRTVRQVLVNAGLEEKGELHAQKQVVQIDDAGNECRVFKSANEAGEFFHVTANSIRRACNGKIKIKKNILRYRGAD